MKWIKDESSYYNTNQIVRIVRDSSNPEYDVAFIYLTDGKCISVLGSQCEEIINFCGESVLEIQKPEQKSSGFVVDIKQFKG